MIRRLVPGPVKRIRSRLRAIDRVPDIVGELGLMRSEVMEVREALGRIEARQLRDVRGSLEDHEFRVFSQAGEDGIIQYLIHNIEIPSRTFVEFGVEDYREANTRFLLVNDRWRGLVIDGNQGNIDRIRADVAFLNSDLTAVAEFVTRENIDEVLTKAGMAGDLGLLSIDVDGNDYWIFDAISVVRPAIAIVEYNHRFGPSRSVTIPYDPSFIRRRTDPSWLFSGASLAALVGAAQRHGMSFVGCNTFGNNAFFVRTDLLPSWLPPLPADRGYVAGRFRESMVLDGRQHLPSPQETADHLAKATLVDV